MCVFVLMGSVRVPQLWVTEEMRSWKGGHAAACSWLYGLVIMASIDGLIPRSKKPGGSFHPGADGTIVTERVVRGCTRLKTMETMA